MSQPSKPQRFEKEGSASPCTIDGVDFKWKNCTCLSCAMGLNKTSYGRVDASGCAIRHATHDTSGGTTIPQMIPVCTAYSVAVEQHTGSNVASMWYLAYQAYYGRGFMLQGNTQPDGRGNVNHAVWVNSANGGTPGNPDYFDVWDPWSSGPAHWSYAKTKAFALALRPYGEKDPRTLKSMGVNGAYALVFADTEPHVHFIKGVAGVTRAVPFPDHQAIKSPVAGRKVNVRSGPGTGYAKLGTIDDGTPWIAFQKVGHWSGNHDGNKWVHDSGTINEGGTS